MTDKQLLRFVAAFRRRLCCGCMVSSARWPNGGPTTPTMYGSRSRMAACPTLPQTSTATIGCTSGHRSTYTDERRRYQHGGVFPVSDLGQARISGFILGATVVLIIWVVALGSGCR